ncbi:hypothetical protein IW150_006631 [Coemansia sp. RSA 2607]|nr:hypothetical protein IW150_006631 [Coemansia sp. RSA 2607]KAJ2382282.1 hypothetical protein GGI05_005703 [Coemansia sp. RSA 2603]
MSPSADVCKLSSGIDSQLLPAETFEHNGVENDNSVISTKQQIDTTVIEPTIGSFFLPAQLPTILTNLGIDIDTKHTEVALQYSVHRCPRRMRREMRLVFPCVANRESELVIIPTFQKTKSSMISYGADTQTEKDDKLQLFYRWGGELVSRLQQKGFWADVTDPMSGMSLFSTSGPSLYPDVEGAEILLKYKPFNLGSCFVLSHPHWGTSIYPASAFTLAPPEVVVQTLEEMMTCMPNTNGDSSLSLL